MSLILYPTPRHIDSGSPASFRMQLGFHSVPSSNFPSAARILDAWLEERGLFHPKGLPVTWRAADDLPAEGYELVLNASGAQVQAADLRGAIYAASTLCQIVEQAAGELPVLTVRDYPDMPVRATHIDLRTQKFRPARLRQILNRLAFYRYNMVVVEYEGTFPLDLAGLPANRARYTQEEIALLYQDALALGIELVPLIQTMGHLEYVLQQPTYLPLCERGAQGEIFIDELCPLHSGSLPFALGLLEQVMAAHPGRFVHIGGDEVWHLGSCPACRERQPVDLYLGHMLPLLEHVHRAGRIPLFWADFLKHYPQAVEQIPAYAIPIEWEYEPDPQEGLASFARLHGKGLAAWTAPAVHCYRSGPYGLDVTGAIRNVEQMVTAAYAAGLATNQTGETQPRSFQPGVLITNWNTGGSFANTLPEGRNISQFGWPEQPAIRAQHRRPHYDITWPLLIWSAECLWNARKTDAAAFWERIGQHLFGVDGPRFFAAYSDLGAMPHGSTPQQVEERFARAYNGLHALQPLRQQAILQQMQLTAEYGWHYARRLVLEADYAAHLTSLEHEMSSLQERLRATYELDMFEEEVAAEMADRFTGRSSLYP